MNVYILTIHDCTRGETEIIGAFDTILDAHKAMDIEMSIAHNLDEFTDWDIDSMSGSWNYFYPGFTAGIQRARVNEMPTES